VRLFFLTSRLPYPPHRGDRVRTFNFLREFATRHDVHLVSFIEGEEERAVAKGLDGLCTYELISLSKRRSLANIAVRALSSQPYQALYYRSGRMVDAVQRVFEGGEFDLAYVHLFRMAPFVERFLERGGQRTPTTVLDLTDSVASEIELSIRRRPLPTRPLYAWECRRIRALERRVLPAFREGWVISEADRQEVLRTSPGSRIEVIPNGVDERLFGLDPAQDAPKEVVFVGNLSVPHNIDAVGCLVREVMPLLREIVPGTTLRVVGRDVGHAVRGICSSVDWCRMKGFVPDLTDAYRGATVFAAPLRFAAGVQNKMLESMAAGIPVVTSPIGNRGLGARDAREIVVADGPEAFARALAEIIADAGLRSRLSEAGRRFVQGSFSWSAAVDRLDALAEEGRAR